MTQAAATDSGCRVLATSTQDARRGAVTSVRHECPIGSRFLHGLFSSENVRLLHGGVGPMAKPVVKCGHCRLPIEDSDLVVAFEGAGLIHVRCWRVSDSETSRQSSNLVRRSRKLIDESRRRLDHPPKSDD